MPDPPPEVGVVFSAAHRRGGVERVAHALVSHLATAGSVTFIGEELDDPPPGAGFVQVRTPSGPPDEAPQRFRAAAAAAVARVAPGTLLSFGVNCPRGDVLWVQSVHRAWLSRGSSVQKLGLTVPNRARRLLRRHRVLLRLEKDYFTGGRPRAIICTSPQEALDLQTFYGVDLALLHVVPNGVDTERFNPSLRESIRAEQRRAMGIEEGQRSLLLVANELHRKGLAVVLDAVAAAGDPRFRIDIVGLTPPTQFRSQISRLGLTDRVHWHGPTDEVERFMAAGDVMVLPTQYEPFGLVIIEALATGLPVVTTALAGAADALRGAEVGWLMEDPHDERGLAALLRDLTDEQLARWTAEAPGAAAPYSWPLVLDRATDIIRGQSAAV